MAAKRKEEKALADDAKKARKFSSAPGINGGKKKGNKKRKADEMTECQSEDEVENPENIPPKALQSSYGRSLRAKIMK